MLLRLLLKDREQRKRVAHIAAGILIFIHAYEKYESGHQSYIFFGIAGIIFSIIALLHPVIERKAPWVDAVFLVIEGILSIIIAIDFFHMGKMRLPIAYLFVAAFQFFMAFKRGKKGIAKHKATH
jgi:hypothetical protein